MSTAADCAPENEVAVPMATPGPCWPRSLESVSWKLIRSSCASTRTLRASRCGPRSNFLGCLSSPERRSTAKVLAASPRVEGRESCPDIERWHGALAHDAASRRGGRHLRASVRRKSEVAETFIETPRAPGRRSGWTSSSRTALNRTWTEDPSASASSIRPPRLQDDGLIS